MSGPRQQVKQDYLEAMYLNIASPKKLPEAIDGMTSKRRKPWKRGIKYSGI